MYQQLLDIEFFILNSLDFLRCSFMNVIMLFFSSLGDEGIIWIALGAILLVPKKTRSAGICVLLALFINLLIVNITIKPLVARIRPFDINQSVRLILEAPHGYSFPSGHTSASFAAAFSVLCYYKKWGWVCILTATIIAFSRLYLYVHFPTDVICGAIFGILSSFISQIVISKTKIFQRLIKD